VPTLRNKVRGNCYVASEALYHLLGGSNAGWKPMNMRVGRESHWFLMHWSGLILDPTALQFPMKLNYSKARGRGFLTRLPSDRARRLMDKILWQRDSHGTKAQQEVQEERRRQQDRPEPLYHD
jgi:hypothetical protein